MNAPHIDLTYGVIFGEADWHNLVIPLAPELKGCRVGRIGELHVALDASLRPTEEIWMSNRERFENYLGTITHEPQR